MLRSFLILVLCFSLQAKITATTVAAVTTISVNLLEIKSTIQKARVAANTIKKTTLKVVKKVGNK